MRSIATLSLIALAGLSAAQDQPQDNYPYTIDPESVKGSLREYWCNMQKSQCPLICLQQPGVTTQNTYSNDCDPETLVYSCVCDNGVAPNITQYTQTLPYYICSEWGNQCVGGCNGVNECERSCREDHPCGAQSPFKPNSTAITSASHTPSKTGDADEPDNTGGNGGGLLGAEDDDDAASSILNLGQSYGMAVLFFTVFAGFAVAL